jgi:hypothetical protein
MGMALAAVADDDNLLALDQIDVCVAIVIDTHGPQVPHLKGGFPPSSSPLHCPIKVLRNIRVIKRRF